MLKKVMAASSKKLVSVKGDFSKVFDSAISLLKNYSNTKSALKRRENRLMESNEKEKDGSEEK